MGSEGSKSNSEKIEEGNGNEGSTLDFTAYIRDNLSNYEGIRSDDENIEEENEFEDTNENQNNSSSSSSSIKDEEKDNSNEKIPTTFQWKEGGNTVYVTGSFCGWQQFFIMSKNEDGNFSLTLPLPKGIIQYNLKLIKNGNIQLSFLQLKMVVMLIILLIIVYILLRKRKIKKKKNKM